MPRIPALAALLFLSACSTTTAVDPNTALSGKPLDSAMAIYGPWQQRLVLAGRPTYVWRRELVEGEARYFCELMIETGFRQTISRSYMQGYPRACLMFDVRYNNKK